jgi:alpha-ketoglutarate-dependent taurine dioxygenase
MAVTLLESLIQTAKKSGWAVGAAPRISETSFLPIAAMLEAQARALGLTAVPNRRGDAPVQELRPTTADTAHPASLSAQVGLGEQPLHTDGAHLRRPPDYVILWCTEVSATPTRLWRPPISRLLTSPDQNGVFLVRSGSDTWLATALSHGDLRFDPGCMTPADTLARRLSSALQAPPEGEVQEVAWDTPGKVLVIRNRRVLHGRGAVVEGDLDRRLSRVAYLESTP